MMGLGWLNLMLAAVPLLGVTGEKLRARAFFDANNVKVGDPLVLTVDFIGTADFKSLHPPALSRYLSQDDWRLDDSSAKTQTESHRVRSFFSSREVDVARRLTYRVRPMREGVLWFPALEFEYEGPDGGRLTVRANEIPVHARKGADVVVAEMGEDETAMPQPGELVVEPGVELGEDDAFSWRRACANPTADAFAQFDFPAAKLNEARCAILGGDWKRALKVYSRLEWRIGQTAEIERGIVAALALRYANPVAELPVWRQVGRPVLRHDWKGRLGLVGGGLAGIVLVFWLLGRVIRALACVALLLALLTPMSAAAQGGDPFAEVHRMMQEQEKRMRQMMQTQSGGANFSISFGGGEESQQPPEVKARLETSNPRPRVGETFEFIIELEAPKTCQVDPRKFVASESFGLTFVTGGGRELPPGTSANPSNAVRRIAIPVRYDAPFRGEVGFTVEGMVSNNRSSGGRNRRFSFSFSTSFSERTGTVPLEVVPLSDPPPGYGGVVAKAMRFEAIPDITEVGTNDVIRVTYRMQMIGFLPENWMPPGSAFEWGRTVDNSGAVTAEWLGYVVADGKLDSIPESKVVYYDPQAKDFKTVRAGGRKIRYGAGADSN